jgi:hypothetical protein
MGFELIERPALRAAAERVLRLTDLADGVDQFIQRLVLILDHVGVGF